MSDARTLLQTAARLLRVHANGALEVGTERWMTDQDEQGGLIVGSFTPGDIDPDTGISTSVVAAFSYSDDDSRAPATALSAAAHIAGLDPQAALALATWLDTAAAVWVSRPDQGALAFARTYLRDDEVGEQR